MDKTEVSQIKTSGIVLGITFLFIPIVALIYSFATFKKNERILIAQWDKVSSENKEKLRAMSSALLATWHATFAQLGISLMLTAFLGYMYGFDALNKTASINTFMFFFIVAAVIVQVWAGVNGFILSRSTYSQEAK